MPYTIKIETKEQFDYLKRIVDNSKRMMHNNTSAYVEYLDMIDALALTFEEAIVEKPPKVEIIETPKKKKTTSRKVSTVAKLPVFCEDHPTYGAKRAPRTACETCWSAYERLNPAQFPAARRKFERAQRADNV